MNENNLELFSLIWFDSDPKIFDDPKINERLRIIINHLQKFNEIKECREYIEQRSQDDRLIILLNGFQCHDVLSNIHHFSQVSAIYSYSIDQSSHQQLSEQFPKVRFR